MIISQLHKRSTVTLEQLTADFLLLKTIMRINITYSSHTKENYVN